jgi:predicted dehydrogenase
MGNYNAVRIGIVGAGVSGSQVHLPVLAANSEVVIEWICDLDLEKAKKIAGPFSVPQTFAEIGQCPPVDIVALTIPLNMRSSAFNVSIDRRWHILIEKPFANNLTHHMTMIDKAKTAGVQLGVMAQRRTYAQYHVVSDLLRSGVLGSIRRVWAADSDTDRRSGIDGDQWISRIIDHNTGTGGFLEETGWHLIDVVLQLVGAKKIEVNDAIMDGIDHINTDVKAESHVVTVNGDDFEMALRLSRSIDIRRGIRIECDRGIIELGNKPGDKVVLKNADDLYVCDLDQAHKFARSSYAAIHQHWQAFINQCKTRTPSVASAESAILTTQFIEDVKTKSSWEDCNG